MRVLAVTNCMDPNNDFTEARLSSASRPLDARACALLAGLLLAGVYKIEPQKYAKRQHSSGLATAGVYVLTELAQRGSGA